MDPLEKPTEPLEKRRAEFVAGADRNVFVIMRYGDSTMYRALEKAIRETVRGYGFEAHLARECWFEESLWPNIEFYMRSSRYGIAVFERAAPPDFNPNVAIELGYMLGMGKKCLILKEDSAPVFSDLFGRLFETFRPGSVRATVPPAINRWMKGLGHQVVRPIETIKAHTAAEAKKRRTRIIIGALEELLRNPGSVLRQGGSLSSFAISADEGILEGEDQELKALLLRERDLFCELVNHGTVVRCLVSPHVQVMSARLRILRKEHLRSDVLPRFTQLRSVINANLENPAFQIAPTPRLPHDNILIDDSTCQVFIGSRKLQEWGFPATNIYRNPDIVRAEVSKFDSAFWDAAAACLGRLSVEEEYGRTPELQRLLKNVVLDQLQACERELVEIANS